MYQQLVNFTEIYHAALETALDRFGRDKLPFYGDRIERIRI
jgi:hypothetical protein